MRTEEELVRLAHSSEVVRMKSEAQSFLEQYETVFAQIECKQAEILQWRDLALSITAHMGDERVQSTGSKSKMADAVERCLATEEELLSQVNRLIARQKEISAVLERMDNPTEYKLLHQRYIQFKQLKTIADNFNASYDWATTTHGRALKSLQAMLDE